MKINILATTLLITLAASPALANTSAPPAPPAAEVESDAQPLRIRHKGLFNGGLRSWSAGGQSVSLVGIELGGNVNNHVAISAELLTNIEGDPMQATAGRVGMRAYLLPGAFSPYAAARVGGLFGNDDAVGIWTASAGFELAVEPSGLLFDLGFGKIGAFGERGTLTEVAISVGKRY